MSSISNVLSQFPDFQHVSSKTPFAVHTQQFQAQAQTSTTSNFSFTTAEGDRISLSSGSESHFSFESYNFQGLAEGQAVDFRSQQLSTSTRSDFSLLIEGDLNEQELADIQAFLQSSKSLLQDITAGDVENATETALSLNKLDSLSNASLFFQQTTTASLAFRSTTLAAQGDDQEHASRQRRSNEGRGLGQRVERIFDNIRKAQEQFQIDPEKLTKRLPSLLSRILETLEKPFTKEESPQLLFEQIRKEFLSSLLQTTEKLPLDEDTPEELTEGANKLEAENSVVPPTVENGETLANLLNESKES